MLKLHPLINEVGTGLHLDLPDWLLAVVFVTCLIIAIGGFYLRWARKEYKPRKPP